MNTLTVEEVLKIAWDRKLPVDVLGIAHNLGFEVFDIRHQGSVEQGNALYIRTQAAVELQRTHLGQQIGIAVLETIDIEEQNRFSRELLVPEKHLKHLIIEKGCTSIPELCKIFNVTYYILSTRLKELGLL